MHPLWRRWIVANALGEMLGLGATLGVGAAYFTLTGEPQGWVAVLLSFLIAVASGLIEATVVGLAQWWAMHPWFPTLARRAWWQATLVGALVAYVMGYLPSTIMSLGQDAVQAGATSEPPQWVVLLLAAVLGAVGGAVLSFAQWLALRRCAPRAGLWIPANMLAWLLGMPVIFWGIDAAQKGQPVLISALILLLTLLVAGAVVGAVHGVALVKIAGEKE